MLFYLQLTSFHLALTFTVSQVTSPHPCIPLKQRVNSETSFNSGLGEARRVYLAPFLHKTVGVRHSALQRRENALQVVQVDRLSVCVCQVQKQFISCDKNKAFLCGRVCEDAQQNKQLGGPPPPPPHQPSSWKWRCPLLLTSWAALQCIFFSQLKQFQSPPFVTISAALGEADPKSFPPHFVERIAPNLYFSDGGRSGLASPALERTPAAWAGGFHRNVEGFVCGIVCSAPTLITGVKNLSVMPNIRQLVKTDLNKHECRPAGQRAS